MARNVFILIFLLVLFAEPLYSRPPNTGATISGTVRDPSGAVVVEARLTLKSSHGDDLVQVRTDSTGEFRFSNVAPGRYLILAEQPGFCAFSQKIEIGRQNLPRLLIKLQLAPLESEITVSPNELSISDPSSNRNAIDLSTRMLSNLPLLDGDYVATLTSLLDQGATGTSGSSIIVDGMEVKDAIVSEAAVQEVHINDDAYSAEFWRPGRARIEIFTKSEGDQFHGALGFSFRDAVFDARNTFAHSRPPEEKRNYDLLMSGPVRKKKDGFFLSLSRNEDDQQSFVFAAGPAGLIHQSVPTPARWTRASARLSHTISASHRLSLEYNFLGYVNDNYGVGGVVLPQAGVDYSVHLSDLSLSDQLTLSTNKVNQWQVRIENYRIAAVSSSLDPKIIVEGAFTTGGAQATKINAQRSVALNDTFSWTRGRNQLKFGVNIPSVGRNSLDDNSDFGGTFYFSDIASYLARQPYLLHRQAGNPVIRFGYKEIAGFAQDQIRIKPRLTGTFGLRYDWQSYFPAGKDFAPRASLAYALDKDSRNVLRLGAGIFDDRTGPVPIADLLRYDGTNLREYLLPNPNFTSPLPPTSGATNVPADIVVLAPDARIPYGIHYSLAIEHQLSHQATIAFTYRGSRDFHLFRSFDINAPPPPNYILRPDANFGIVRQIQSAGRQNNDGFDLTFHGSLTKYFTGQAQYTLSWTKNDTSGIAYFPSNNYDLSGEWARSDWDRRHRFYLLGSTYVKNWFTLGVVLFLASGKPYTVTTGADTYNDGMDNARPAGVPRNSMQGKGYTSLDLRLSHDFRLKPKDKKGPTFNASLEGFNVLNRANFNAYGTVLTSPLFGQPVTAYPARRLQITIRFNF